jgi:hypothetical protein
MAMTKAALMVLAAGKDRKEKWYVKLGSESF